MYPRVESPVGPSLGSETAGPRVPQGQDERLVHRGGHAVLCSPEDARLTGLWRETGRLCPFQNLLLLPWAPAASSAGSSQAVTSRLSTGIS